MPNKEWCEAHKHPCIDCGKLCSYRAIRCHSCGGKQSHPKQFFDTCIDCGKPVWRKSIRCRSCLMKYRWRNGRGNPPPHSKGIDSPNWKGGRMKVKAGYIRLYKPNHPRQVGNYVLEHIVVWEEVNRKPLPKGWIIHHLNGIPDDNRIVNLVAMQNQKHKLLLQAKAKRIQELEALLKQQGQLI